MKVYDSTPKLKKLLKPWSKATTTTIEYNEGDLGFDNPKRDDELDPAVLAEVGRLKDLRVPDEEFLKEIQHNTPPVMKRLLEELQHQRNECAEKLRQAADEFHKTGIPAAPVWWEKTKTLRSIRDKHILMIARQLELAIIGTT